MGNLNLSPLAGKRVVVTRAAEQNGELIQELASRGAIPVLLPLLSFAAPDDYAPVDAAVGMLAEFDWVIFTSVNAVRAVAARTRHSGYGEKQSAGVPNVATVGPATTAAAKEAGFRVTHMATTHNGITLARELGERVRDKKVFLPRSDHANPDLPDALRKYGGQVTEVVAYRTVAPTSTEQRKWSQMLNDGADAILFFSPTAVTHLAEQLEHGELSAAQDRMAMVAIGPVTANALKQANIERMTVAADTTPVAAVKALEEYFARKQKQEPAGVKQG